MWLDIMVIIGIIVIGYFAGKLWNKIERKYDEEIGAGH